MIAARAAGAGTIIVTGLATDAHKLALAREFGADHTIVVDDDGRDTKAGGGTSATVQRVTELTDGRSPTSRWSSPRWPPRR